MMTTNTANSLVADSQSSSRLFLRQAEALIHKGDSAKALRICAEAIAFDDLDLPSVDVALWIARTGLDLDLAASVAKAGARLAPLDPARQKAAASSLAGLRRFDEALTFARRASDLDPDDLDCLFFTGVLLNEAGYHAAAINQLLAVIKRSPSFPEAFHHLAYASMKLERLGLAAKLAEQAWQLEPSNPSRAMFAAHLLRQVDDLTRAIDVLRAHEPQGEGGADMFRALGSYLYEAGDFQEALNAIDSALKLKPNVSEYLLFRSSLLMQLGRSAEAVDDVDKVIEAEPDNLSARRHAVTVYLQGNAFERAVESSAELLSRAPDNDEYASCMIHVLASRSEASVVLPNIRQLKQERPPRPQRAPPTFLDGLKTQGRVIPALLLREMRTRFGESRLGYLWVLVEMIIHLGVLALVFQFMMHGQPPIGHSFFFFYFTGLTPYLLFLHTSEQGGHAIIQNRHMLQLPMVTNVDVILSRGLVELFTQLLVTILFTIGFLVAGVDALPHDVGGAISAFFVAWSFGLSIGYINAVLNTFFHVWHHLFGVVTRFLYFCSGIFYVPGAMPIRLREILEWNPLLHCVDWFRRSYFASYDPHWLNRGYAVLASLFLLFVGLGLEAVFRPKLHKPA